jgi:hypothetical protein
LTPKQHSFIFENLKKCACLFRFKLEHSHKKYMTKGSEYSSSNLAKKVREEGKEVIE